MFTDSRKKHSAPHSIEEWRFMLSMGLSSVLTHIHFCVPTTHFCNALFFKTIMYVMSPEKNGLFLYSFPTQAAIEGVKAQGRQLWFSISVWLYNNQNVALATRMSDCEKIHTVKHRHRNAQAAQDQRQIVWEFCKCNMHSLCALAWSYTVTSLQ